MTAGVKTPSALDVATNLPFPTQWWDDGSGNLQLITKPTSELPSGISPVTGQFTGVQNGGSFGPIPGRGFNVTVTGAFTGSIQPQRSFDDGATWLDIYDPITAPATMILKEPEANVLYRLNCTALSAGTPNYRLSQ